MEHTIVDELRGLFLRELDKLEKEITRYPDETSLWRLHEDIKNSGGTLCLHLCGNLQHYVGAVLGNSGYIRNRDAEFAERTTPRQKLIDEINRTREVVQSTLGNLDDSLLKESFPEQVFGHPMTTSFFLFHLLAHFNYHLGQVNYHRRMINT